MISFRKFVENIEQNCEIKFLYRKVENFLILYFKMRLALCRCSWRGNTWIQRQHRSRQRNLFMNISSHKAEVVSSALPSTSESTQLWNDIIQRYDAAQAASTSSMTQTNTELVNDAGVQFILKIATTLRDKPKAPPSNNIKKEWKNPFLPPEPDLFVKHLSSTHSLVLNKFNIVPHHTLVITRDFHPQEEPLNASDFDATWHVIKSMPQGGLAYFNCGPVSGASQPHKHLQIVPLPLLDTAPLPFGPCIHSHMADTAPWTATAVPSMPFIHSIAKIDPGTTTGPLLAQIHSSLLQQSIASVHAAHPSSKNTVDTEENLLNSETTTACMSYNLVMTREFIMIVPRSHDSIGPVSCNAMAYAGSFFVRSIEELEFIRKEGPMKILSRVGYPSID